MAYDAGLALQMVKARLDRLRVPPIEEEYLKARIEAAAKRMARIGIHLDGSQDDLMLLVDMTVFDYQNRDKPGSMPEWLRIARRERWLSDGGEAKEPGGSA